MANTVNSLGNKFELSHSAGVIVFADSIRSCPPVRLAPPLSLDDRLHLDLAEARGLRLSPVHNHPCSSLPSRYAGMPSFQARLAFTLLRLTGRAYSNIHSQKD
jgi:hypothetical protein